MTTSASWPLHDLILRTPRLTLRPVRDSDLDGLVAAATAGIFDDGSVDYAFPWQQGSRDTVRRNVVQHQWQLRAALRPDDWTLQFTVRAGGEPLGVQDLAANRLAARRTVNTASWLTRSAQGHGIGTEMRQAVLLFAFDVLGARFATSAFAMGNESSAGVCRKLGYRPNGVGITENLGKVVHEQYVQLDSLLFARPSWQLDVQGWEAAKVDLLESSAAYGPDSAAAEFQHVLAGN